MLQLVVKGGVAVVVCLLSFGWAAAHEADLNDRVTFYVTAVEQTQVEGEPALVLSAVLDNGTRNRLTLRGVNSNGGGKTVLYSIKTVYGLETLFPRKTLSLRSGQGVEISRPDLLLVVSDLTTASQFRKPFTLDLTFNRAIGDMSLEVSFLVNDELEHGRGVIDIGPPAALAGETPEVEWMTTDDLKGDDPSTQDQ